MPDAATPGRLGLTAAEDQETWWHRVLELLRPQVNPQAFATWLRPTRQLAVSGHRLLVLVPSAHFASWIAATYAQKIERALADLGLTGFAVEYSWPPEGQRPSAAAMTFASALTRPTRADVASAYKQHPITFRVSAGIIDPKHRRAMSGAIWTYLWCLDKQTGPDGLIYAGRPVTISEIAASLAFTPRHTSRQLDRLVDRKYVAVVERRPEGLVLRVNSQKKFPPKAGGSRGSA